MYVISSFKGKYKFLSNFYPCDVEFNNIVYPCVENAFQAQKTTNRIKQMSFIHVSPKTAKKLGREVKLRKDWECVKLKVMEDLVRIKFSNPELASLLKSTKGYLLVEGNTWGDDFWGVCNPEKGKNNLGKILMKVRDEL